ncbi:MAG: leucine-rich repeat protein, partial [Clostridia bacterium]|nr:leucine-rich repeat protein [Clostridia bacterium]
GADEDGRVVLPDDRGFTTIYDYAFSGSKYVEKDLSAGDVIDDEDPYHIKQTFVGENDTVTEIVIPEGVTTINSYAFANMKSLRKVTLPSTLTRIGLGAFYLCENLEEVNFEHVQFINKDAFSGCKINRVDCTSLIAVGDYAFKGCLISNIEFSDKTRTIGKGAFSGNEDLATAKFNAPQVIIGSNAFEGCKNLTSVYVNASVISSYVFYKSGLKEITLGKDVSVIGEYAFAETGLERFRLDTNNTHLSLGNGGAALYDSEGKTLIAVVPTSNQTFTTDAEVISAGAFAGNKNLKNVLASNVKTVEPYAFSGCSNLVTVTFGNLSEIGDGAFEYTALKSIDISGVQKIGNRAFYGSSLTSVTVPADIVVGDYAFAECLSLKEVTINGGVQVGDYAFWRSNVYDDTILNQEVMFAEDLSYKIFKTEDGVISIDERFFYWLTPQGLKDLLRWCNFSQGGDYYKFNYAAGYNDSDANHERLSSVSLGDGVTLGKYAFAGNIGLSSLTLGDGVEIGDYAFFNDYGLVTVDLSKVTRIGEGAFSGSAFKDIAIVDNEARFAYNAYGNEIYSVFSPSVTEADISSATYVGRNAFAYNDKLTKVVLGENITEISDGTFKNCFSLNEINIPASVASIGASAFFGVAVK